MIDHNSFNRINTEMIDDKDVQRKLQAWLRKPRTLVLGMNEPLL